MFDNMHNELAESAISGHYLSEYNNGAMSAGLCVIRKREGFTNNIQVIRLTECFDEVLLPE
ncbi:367_t:CDS:2, partial [Funneliformis mosseae]